MTEPRAPGDGPLLVPLEDTAPQVHGAWVAPTAVLSGDVRLGPGASVWYGCVLRGDGDVIAIGANSNVQDLTVMHADPGKPVRVGDGVTIGHRALLHGCTIGDGALVGMGAIVLNHANVGAGSLIGAGALVTEGATIPPRSLVLGSPAKVIRTLTDDELAAIAGNADIYLRLAARYA